MPYRVCMFVSSKGVSMKNTKQFTLINILIGVMILLCCKTEAQLNAQSDLFNVLQNSCSYYLDVIANDNTNNGLIGLQIHTQATNGIASTNGNFLSYCPQQGFLGADQFSYLITDSTGTDTATVFINVLSGNNFIFSGDADQNGKVENFDVLTLGLAYNLVGPSRFDSTSVNALAWTPAPFLNSNPGAADCNGDGIVDGLDLISIETAYHDSFPFPSSFEIDTSVCSGTGIPFYIESLSGDSVYSGDSLDIVIKLGNDFSSNEAYGIAFDLDGNGVQFNASQSWLLQSDAGLFFNRSFQATGKTEIALTKTNHIAANGGGELLRARLPIDDNIDGLAGTPGWHNLILKLKRVRLISPYNIVRDVCIQQPSIMVYKMVSGIRDIKNGSLKIYPNPTNSMVFIEAENIREVEIVDLMGRKINSLQTDAVNKIQIDINEFSLVSGNYLLKIKTADFVFIQKIFVVH